MHQVQHETTEQIERLTQQMLLDAPMPVTDDILERTRHLNDLKIINYSASVCACSTITTREAREGVSKLLHGLLRCHYFISGSDYCFNVLLMLGI